KTGPSAPSIVQRPPNVPSPAATAAGVPARVTFLLTNGGHNAGITAAPATQGRHYRFATKREHDRYIDPDTWIEHATLCPGSWWPEWARWLAERSGDLLPARVPGRGLGDAPGTYVLQS